MPIWMQGPSDWYESVGVELAVTWGTVARFQWELRNLRYVRAITCWMEGTQDDLRDRRRAVLGIARGIISQNDSRELELDNLWPLIPVETVSPRLANLICVAYKEPPERTYSKTDEEINAGFDDFYDTLNINEVLDQAYRAALFTNCVLILWSEEENKFLVLTPEYFRIADNGIWIARRTGYTQAETALYWKKDAVPEGEIVFDVWTDTTHEVRNHSGALMASQCEENPWGMFPGVLLKLTPSNDLYGAGIAEAAEINACSNLLDLFALRIALYQGFSVAVGTNIKNDSGGSGAKNNIRIAPGKLLNLQDPDGTAHPDFKFVTPNGKFLEIQEFKQKKIAAFCRSTGLPNFIVDEAAGTPPSGIALSIMERPLNNLRRDHLPALRRTEKTLLKFIQKLARKKDRPALIADTFEINYAKQQEFVNPSESFAFDLTLSENGLMNPSTLVQKYMGTQRGMTDEKALEILKQNKSQLSFLTEAPIADVK